MLYWGHETTQITQNVKNKKIVWFGVWAFFQHPISFCSFNSAEIEIQAWSSFFYCQDLSTLSFPNVRQQSNFDTFGTICRKKGFFLWKWIAFGRQCMAIVQSSFYQNGCWKRPPYLHTYYWKEIQISYFHTNRFLVKFFLYLHTNVHVFMSLFQNDIQAPLNRQIVRSSETIMYFVEMMDKMLTTFMGPKNAAANNIDNDLGTTDNRPRSYDYLGTAGQILNFAQTMYQMLK